MSAVELCLKVKMRTEKGSQRWQRGSELNTKL